MNNFAIAILWSSVWSKFDEYVDAFIDTKFEPLETLSETIEFLSASKNFRLCF